jgi:hypothetical protein
MTVVLKLTAVQEAEIAELWRAAREPATGDSVVGELRRINWERGQGIEMHVHRIPARVADAMRAAFVKEMKKGAK